MAARSKPVSKRLWTNWEGQLKAWARRHAQEPLEPLPHHWTTLSGTPRCAACGQALPVQPKSAMPPYACEVHHELVEQALLSLDPPSKTG